MPGLRTADDFQIVMLRGIHGGSHGRLLAECDAGRCGAADQTGEERLMVEIEAIGLGAGIERGLLPSHRRAGGAAAVGLGDAQTDDAMREALPGECLEIRPRHPLPSIAFSDDCRCRHKRGPVDQIAAAFELEGEGALT